MTTLPNLPDTPTEPAEGELLYVRPASGPENAKRSFGSLWRNVLGLTAAAQRTFFGATPVSQPASAGQAKVATPDAGAPVATTAATNTTPYSFTTAAQADDLVSWERAYPARECSEDALQRAARGAGAAWTHQGIGLGHG